MRKKGLTQILKTGVKKVWHNRNSLKGVVAKPTIIKRF